jgi:hypothetical protein
MPKVGKKKFPYTKAGRAAAEREMLKKQPVYRPKSRKKVSRKDVEKYQMFKNGGSVSRGQYPVQTQKVKFKGVF